MNYLPSGSCSKKQTAHLISYNLTCNSRVLIGIKRRTINLMLNFTLCFNVSRIGVLFVIVNIIKNSKP